MTIPGVKPERIEKRLKMMVYGRTGTRKTTTALGFPRPFIIDAERGAENDQYVKLMHERGAQYFGVKEGANDPESVITAIVALIGEKHDFRTFIIDPLTPIYNDLLDKAAEKMGTDFGRHKGPADRRIKHLLNLLLRLDMNVIVTSHAKPNWVRAKDEHGKPTVVEEGLTFDCYSKLDYLFDLVLQTQLRGNGPDGTVQAVVHKSRIEAFSIGEDFPFCYDEIADRYGRDILEKHAEPVKLASAAQVETLSKLLADRKDGEELTEKWLDKAAAERFEEMKTDDVDKCIAFLRGRQQAANGKKE